MEQRGILPPPHKKGTDSAKSSIVISQDREAAAVQLIQSLVEIAEGVLGVCEDGMAGPARSMAPLPGAWRLLSSDPGTGTVCFSHSISACKGRNKQK